MAWSFNEVDQYVTVASDAALDFPDADWAIGGWVNFDDNAGSGYQYVITRWDTALFLMILGEEDVGANANKWQARWDDGPDNGQSMGTITVDAGNWHHFLAQRSGNTLYSYRDNVEVATADLTNVDAVAPSADLIIGTNPAHDADRCFGGDLAEWAKWDRALTEDERAALVKGFAPSFFRSGLAWYLPMLRDHVEIVHGLAVTNHGSVVAEHPPIIRPDATHIRG